jgi:hypothetical protein
MRVTSIGFGAIALLALALYAPRAQAAGDDQPKNDSPTTPRRGRPAPLEEDTTKAAAPEAAPAPAPSSAPSSAPPPTPPPPPAAHEPAPASEDATAPAPASSPLGFIERQPPSAFPTEPIRGLHGGSLWQNFHGQQFPYYPKTGIGVSGYVWLDTGYEKINRGGGAAADPGITYWLQQGRALLRITPTWSDGNWFVQGQAEFIANKDQTQTQPVQADTDDVWIKIGQWKSWDVQVGRFAAWELYHTGLGLDWYTLERVGASDALYSVPAIYGVTFYCSTSTCPIPAGIGQVAAHAYATKNLRFEALGQIGDEFAGENGLGARGAAIYDLGWMKLKGGGEYKVDSDQNDGGQGELIQRGAGGTAQFVIDPWVEFGANFAYGIVDHRKVDGTTDAKGSYNTYSAGGFLTFRPFEGFLVGGGYDYTYLEDTFSIGAPYNRNEKYAHTQAYGALQYYLLKQVFVKVVGGYAKGQFAPDPTTTPAYDNEMFSVRLRLQYLF